MKRPTLPVSMLKIPNTMNSCVFAGYFIVLSRIEAPTSSPCTEMFGYGMSRILAATPDSRATRQNWQVCQWEGPWRGTGRHHLRCCRECRSSPACDYRRQCDIRCFSCSLGIRCEPRECKTSRWSPCQSCRPLGIWLVLQDAWMGASGRDLRIVTPSIFSVTCQVL